MTKNYVKSRLEFAINLATECKKILEFTKSQINVDVDDYFFDMIQTTELTDIEEIMKRLEDFGLKLEEGHDISFPIIDVNPAYIQDISISRKVRGGNFVASLGESDYDTPQASLTFKAPNGCIWDLALAEQKGGGLADLDGLLEDNQDISIYMYGNPLEEDYTHREDIKYEDIAYCILNDGLYESDYLPEIEDRLLDDICRKYSKFFAVGDNKMADYEECFKKIYEQCLPKDRIFLVQWIKGAETGAFLTNEIRLCEYLKAEIDCKEKYEIFDVTIPGKTRKCHYKGIQPSNLIEVIYDDDNSIAMSLFA